MLIPTIEFDLRNPSDNSDTRFVVENTEDNWLLVAHDKRTHNIQFGQQFDFQFAHSALNQPKFIKVGEALLDSLTNCLDETSDYDPDFIDDFDVMV